MLDNRDVDPTVPVSHLVGPPTQRPAEDLVAETDPEQWQPSLQHFAGQRDRVVRGGRITRPVGQEDTVGRQL
jgi:hypothetical protein